MSKTTVELIFQGIDQTGTATNSALNNVKKFDDRMGKLSGSTAALGGSVNSLATSMLSFGQDVLMRSIDNAASYETALVAMKRINDESVTPIEKVETAVASLAAQYGMTATEVMLSAVEFKKSGEEALDAVNLVEDAIRLSIAGNIDLASSSEFLKASLAGFKAEASDAPELVDLFNQAANRYNTSVEEIADGFTRLSPLASAANLSFLETAAVLTPVIEVFGSGAEAANGLKTIFLRLSSDTAGVVEGLRILGVDQKNLNGEMKTGAEIYWEVGEAWQTIDQNQKLVLAGQIAGINQAVKFAAAMDGFATTLEMVGDSFDYLGSAQAEVDMVMETFAFRMSKNAALMEGIFGLLGRIVLEEAGNVQGAVSRILDAVIQNIASGGQIKEFFELISTLIGRFARELGTFADNLPKALESADFSPFIRSVEKVAESIGNLFSDWDVTSVEGIEGILTGIGNLFEFLASMAAGFIKSFQEVFNVIGGADNEFKFLNNDMAEMIGNIQGLIAQIKAISGGFQNLHLIMQAATPILAGIAGAVTVLLGPKLALAAAIGAVVAAIAAINWDKLLTPLNWVRERLFNVKEDTEKLEQATGRLEDSFDDLGQSIDKSLSSVHEKFNPLITSGLINIEAQTERWISALSDAEDQSESLAEAIKKGSVAYDDVLLAVTDLREGQQLFFDETEGKWIRFGDNIDEVPDRVKGIGIEVDSLTQRVRMSMDDMADSAHQLYATVDEDNENLIQNLETGAFTLKTTVDGVVTFTQASSKAISDVYRESEQSAEDAIRQSKEFIMQMEELASNERIALIEAKVTLDVAQIEADTRRVESAFESLNVGIQSTGETMLGLFGLLGNDDLWGIEKFMLRDAIKAEREFREQEFRLQKDLIESEINLNRQRAASMARGEALIQIDGAGLAPHLEAFMWETLRAIQVRVNEDGLDMLLGTT